jgi:hypothetical protein
MRPFALRCSALLLAVSLTAASAFATDAGTTLNATILARVLSYELTLEERAGENIGIAVVYKAGDAESETSAIDWVRALDELSSVRIKNRKLVAVRVPSDPEQLGGAVQAHGIDVILAADDLSQPETKWLAGFARAHQILTVGSNLAYVEGDLTLCVREENDRPRIFINLTNANLEGIRFSSNVLKLAKLLR